MTNTLPKLPLCILLMLSAGCAISLAQDGPEQSSPSNFGPVLYLMITATVGLVIGFLVGASKAQDGGIRISVHRHHHRSQAGWDRIAKRIQDGTKLGLDDWRGAGHGADGDWDDLTRRIKERIFGEMREHSD